MMAHSMPWADGDYRLLFIIQALTSTQAIIHALAETTLASFVFMTTRKSHVTYLCVIIRRRLSFLFLRHHDTGLVHVCWSHEQWC